MKTLKAPFPAFGGKSKVAKLVWQRLGNVDNFIEPFCNSAAVLLQRPHAGAIETINDWDCYTANFWRATRYAAEKVAEFADNPVNEADLHARHRFLVLGYEAQRFRERMRSDPDYFDCRFAGWWVWGISCWIGSSWCDASRCVNSDCETTWQQQPKAGGGQFVNQRLSQQVPFLNKFGGDCVPECSSAPQKGLSQALPQLSDTRGDIAGPSDTHRPQLADAFSRGRGVNGNDSAGTCAERQAWLQDWFRRLRDRLRTVRVCCGDWQRVCDSPSTTTRLGLTGIFLDAPYRTQLADGKSNRSDGIYASDRDSDVNTLVDRVIAYCRERGSDPQMRLAACCYEGEGYECLAELGWTVEEWKANGGYGNQSGQVNENASRERIWFSPHCKQPEQPSLFQLDSSGSEALTCLAL